MTPFLLQKVCDLVNAGATVVGSRPTRSPSLTDYPRCDEEVSRLAGKLWGETSAQPAGERSVGKGLVIWGKTPEKVLQQKKVVPDFSCALSECPVSDFTTSLAARVSFDEKDSTTALNAASNVNVELVGGKRVPGIGGDALLIDQATRASFDLSKLGPLGDFTIAAWVQLPTITNDMEVLVNADGSDLMLRKGSLEEGGGFEFFIRQNGELEPRVSSGNKVSPGEWYHLATKGRGHQALC